MEAKEISSLIGTEVMDSDSETVVEIIGYNKGWVEVRDTIEDENYKVRAKQLELITEENKKEAHKADPSGASSNEPGEDIENPFDVACPLCSHTWATTKRDNYKCKECGHMFQIRLHPNTDDYVIGLSTTESGRDTMDINDDIAGKLRGMSIEDVYDKVTYLLINQVDKNAWFSKANAKKWKEFHVIHNADKGDEFEVSEREDCYEALVCFLWSRYSHLNFGMQRMNLGNLLRGAIKRNSEVKAKAKKSEANAAK